MAQTIDAVAIKLPTFWTSSPQAWFLQAEAQFAIRGVTQDDTKYFHVVAALDTATANRALSLLTSPPEHGKYQALKDFLLSAFCLSEHERASILLNIQGLGDRRPSQLMDEMLALLGNHQPCFLFRHLFLAQLPESVRIPLASSSTKDYRTLALEADTLLLASAQQVNQTDFPDTFDSQEVCASSYHKQKHPSTGNSFICWFHKKFGSAAKKCTPACSLYSKFQRNQGNFRQGQL